MPFSTTIEQAMSNPFAKVRVLVVEDNPIIRRAEVLPLIGAGYDVLEARSVAGGLMHLDDQNLVAIVLDLHLPNGHGKRIIESLKEKRDDVPIIIVSGFSEEIEIEFPVIAEIKKRQAPLRDEDRENYKEKFGDEFRTQLLARVMEAHKYSAAIKELRATTRKLSERNERSTRLRRQRDVMKPDEESTGP